MPLTQQALLGAISTTVPPTQGCPEAPFDLHNYRDMMDDACMYRFTVGQARRMADSWVAYRMRTGSGS
ncbi:hypothetical protein ACH4C2_03895 [Streptomyces sp. NPDC018057]|uniref:hypothetical protein n=1 Tax=unclassified Streptomyces TaxID=2593676 RepID=UPI003796E46D